MSPPRGWLPNRFRGRGRRPKKPSAASEAAQRPADPPRVEIVAEPHPTDKLVVCENCGESYAGFTTVKEAAEWVAQHVKERHS